MREDNNKRRQNQFRYKSRAHYDRLRYQKLKDKREADEKTMTYDDYVKSISDADKIIDIDEDEKLIENIRNMAFDKFGLYRHKIQQKLASLRLKGTITTHFKPLLVATTVFISIVLAFSMFGAKDNDRSPESQVAEYDEEVLGAASQNEASPDYRYFKPNSNDSNMSEASYDSSKKVVAYKDTLQGFPITLSQQKIASNDSSSTSKIIDHIKVNLDTKGIIETNKGKAYITQLDLRTNTQTVFFVKDDLLVFLNSKGVSLNNSVWKSYIDKLSY